MDSNNNKNNGNGNNDNKFDKFTKEARFALIVAQEKAKETNMSYVGTEHILLGILSQSNSLGAVILKSYGVTVENVYLVLKTVSRVATKSEKGKGTSTKNGLSAYAKKVIEESVKIAHKYGHSFVGTEHLLYSLLTQEKQNAASVILENMKVNTTDVMQQIEQTFQKNKDNSKPALMMNPLEFFLSGLQGVMSGNMNNNMEEGMMKKQGQHGQKGKEAPSKTPALDYFTTDLVKEYREQPMDPIIGRSKEIKRLVSILSRKTKNNPVLIGEPGVGKTAVVEGLAQAIVKDELPDSMSDKRILSLSMSSVVAGTKYRGEFEERFKQIIDEAASIKNVILFIDELHTVIGAGSAEGSLDAANILKPALSKSKIQVIGATTINEYRKHIETDTALERRFQTVLVAEPSFQETVDIMKGLKEAYEDHHGLTITNDAILSSIKMSQRYLHDRFLPDKSIDLLDEACALKSVSNNKKSDKVKNYQKELNAIIKSKEDSVSNQDYEKAAEFRNKELEVLKKIEDEKTIKIPKNKRMKVSEDDIANVVSDMTGIPVSKLVKTDAQKLMKLEDSLKKHIIGQNDALNLVSQSIRRSRVGISDHNRPIGSFIFLGPTGVGKTELVKTLAREIFNDKDALIKIDMSEFMERHNTSRLVGATAGYVGYEDGGQLTEAVRRKPYSVVLFDEIEKAHPDVFNLLLQIMEDGVLTDSKGRQVDFKNTIIIMTSNIGAEKLTQKAGPMGFSHDDEDEIRKAENEYMETKDLILEELKNHFRPEFLNRVDKIVVFNPLTHKSIKDIVKLHLGYLQERIDDKKIKIKLTPKALELLAKESYDPQFGARPVRRKIQELIEDPLTEKLLNGDVEEGNLVNISTKGKKLEIGCKPKNLNRK